MDALSSRPCATAWHRFAGDEHTSHDLRHTPPLAVRVTLRIVFIREIA
jgi:hypothetical protein